MKRSGFIDWNWFLGTALVLAGILSAAIWEAVQDQFNPPRPLDVVPAADKSASGD